ncbi:MAG: TagA domain-containing protein [Aureliella sp.]
MRWLALWSRQARLGKGYYDPRGELQSYIYPALHGACGFCYPDDSGTLNDTDSHLLVETRDGVLRFRLANQRLADNCMNKFHVNVPEASQPRRVAVVSRNRQLDEEKITPVTEKLIMTVNGIPVSSTGSAPTKPPSASGGPRQKRPLAVSPVPALSRVGGQNKDLPRYSSLWPEGMPRTHRRSQPAELG